MDSAWEGSPHRLRPQDSLLLVLLLLKRMVFSAGSLLYAGPVSALLTLPLS